MKKKYTKPAMQVYEMKNSSKLLVGSLDDYPYDFG